jgi:hypothetical protein
MAFLALLAALSVAATAPALARQSDDLDDGFTQNFNSEYCIWSPFGPNLFFSLMPGTVHVLEGEEDGEIVRTVETVLSETRMVDGKRTRVIEERHYVDGELDEVSRNFYALCIQNNSIFYFGEEVDYYEDGEIIGHEGAWLAGEDGARYGLYMPALPLLGARFYQEIAPGAALDRAEIVSLTASADVPAGSYEGCIQTLETTPLEPEAEDIKVFCPGVGIVNDNGAVLIEYHPGRRGRHPGLWD